MQTRSRESLRKKNKQFRAAPLASGRSPLVPLGWRRRRNFFRFLLAAQLSSKKSGMRALIPLRQGHAACPYRPVFPAQLRPPKGATQASVPVGRTAKKFNKPKFCLARHRALCSPPDRRSPRCAWRTKKWKQITPRPCAVAECVSPRRTLPRALSPSASISAARRSTITASRGARCVC